MNPSVIFRCKSCGEKATDIYWDGGEIAGFAHCLEWLSPANGPDPENPRLLERPPAVGERHWAAVRFPFRSSSEQPFWCLYQPPLSYFNGWGEFPEDIAQSSLICCQLLDVKDVESSSAKVRVEIEDAVPVPEIGGWPVTGTAGSVLDVFDDHRRSQVSRWEKFTHLSYSFEGDVGGWAIVEQREGGDFLLLHGEWSWHRDWFHAGNRSLDERGREIIGRIAGPCREGDKARGPTPP